MYAHLQLLYPIAFIAGLFFNIDFQILAFSFGIFLTFCFLIPKIFSLLIFFAFLGCFRGSYIEKKTENYTYKRAQFEARVIGIIQKQEKTKILLDQIKKVNFETDYKIDEFPILPSHGEMLIPDGAYLANGFKIRAVGRFMPPMPNFLVEKFYKNTKPMGKIDFYEIIESSKKDIRTQLREKMNANFSHKGAMIGKAILLGESSGIDKQTRKEFQESGLSHLLGVSVLNIAIIGLVFGLIVRWGIGICFYKIAFFVPLVLIQRSASLSIAIVYSAIVGFEFPLQRSILMSGIAILALFSGSGRSVESLFWSAALILGIDPEAIWNISFQLSIGAVLGLCAAPRLNLSNKVTNWLAQSLWSSLWASMMMIPISLYHFGVTSMQPFLSNIIAIPFVTFVVTPMAMLWLLGFALGFDQKTGFLLDYALVWLNKIAIFMAPIGLNFKIEPIPFYGCVCLSLGMVIFAVFKRKIGYSFLICGILGFLSCFLLTPKRPFVIIHPYSIGIIMQDKIIAYPKCNFIAKNWEEAYSLPCFDGKNSSMFIKEKCGAIIINYKDKIRLIFNELKGFCEMEAKNIVLPFSKQYMNGPFILNLKNKKLKSAFNPLTIPI